MRKNPTIRVRRADKRVNKALSIFEKAANELEIASAQQLAVVDAIDAETEVRANAIGDWYVAEEERIAALITSEAAQAASSLVAQLAAVEVLCEQAHQIEDDAAIAQARADTLRSLLAVA